MKILEKKYKDWDKDTQRKLMRATIKRGYMKQYVKALPESQTYVIMNDKQVMGWALIVELKVGNHLNIFINRRYRRQGLGKLLISKAIAQFTKVIMTNWNKQTRIIFRKQKALYPANIKVINWGKQAPRYDRMLAEINLRNKLAQ